MHFHYKQSIFFYLYKNVEAEIRQHFSESVYYRFSFDVSVLRKYLQIFVFPRISLLPWVEGRGQSLSSLEKRLVIKELEYLSIILRR